MENRFSVYGKPVRSRYKVWSTREIEFPTFQFKMVSDFSAFLRYQIGDRRNKRMFGGVLVAGISNWRRFRQYKRTSFQLIPTFQTLLSRQLVWILFSLSLSVSWELLCNFVSRSFQLLRGILPGSTFGIASHRETGKLQADSCSTPNPLFFSLLDFYDL